MRRLAGVGWSKELRTLHPGGPDNQAIMTEDGCGWCKEPGNHDQVLSKLGLVVQQLKHFMTDAGLGRQEIISEAGFGWPKGSNNYDHVVQIGINYNRSQVWVVRRVVKFCLCGPEHQTIMSMSEAALGGPEHQTIMTEAGFGWSR